MQWTVFISNSCNVNCQQSVISCNSNTLKAVALKDFVFVLSIVVYIFRLDGTSPQEERTYLILQLLKIYSGETVFQIVETAEHATEEREDDSASAHVEGGPGDEERRLNLVEQFRLMNRVWKLYRRK
jgi:hypothetical protein